MADAAAVPVPMVLAPLSMWLADRSRYETGVGHCRRDRYLSYHAGPHGYGWARRAQSVPTVTGTLVHQPMTAIWDWCAVNDGQLPPDTYVQATLDAAVETYRQIAHRRGLTNLMDPADLERRLVEQTTLLEGLTWAWVRVVLPSFIQQFQVIETEREDVSVIGCTCGLGDLIGTAEQHDSRDCRGVGWMSRGDCLARDRVIGGYSYHEVKTTALATKDWEAAFKYKPQLLVGMLGAEVRRGVTIDSAYIHAMIKGRYESQWDPETKSPTGPKFQNSELVYGWRRPANPPLLEEEWALAKNYTDAAGRNRRLGKDFLRTGVWELPATEWQHGCLSPSDYWTRLLAADNLLAPSVRVIGPLTRDDWKVKRFLRQVVAEETRWQAGLWRLHEYVSAHAPASWADDGFQALLDELFPQASGQACHQYFGEQCGNLGLCERAAGWEDPALMGYVPRRPHHVPEMDQAVGRGLLPAEFGLTDDVEG